jgi:hypothetical protein
VELGRVRMWQRVAVERRIDGPRTDALDWDLAWELDRTEAGLQQVYAEVGMILAQLSQVEAAVKAARRGLADVDKAPKQTFGQALRDLLRILDERDDAQLFVDEVDVLLRALTVRNHLAHGTVSVAICARGGPHEGEVAEVFWLDGSLRTNEGNAATVTESWTIPDDLLAILEDALDLPALRQVAETAVDAAVSILAAYNID